MKTVRRVLFLFFISLFVMSGVFAAEVPSESSLISDVPTYTDNTNLQNYSVWAHPVYSHLIDKGNGFERVEYENINDKPSIISTLFDSNFNPVSEKIIELELPIYGGFYSGRDYYFLVVGQTNHEENDNKEVIRVIKYDKNWNRLGQASLYGINTVIPFEAGSLRMTEYNDNLLIRTCHEMYTSSDGLNHQANLPIQISIPDMSVVDVYYDVMNYGIGYVSHSFNQFLVVDREGNLICLDHGDAHPRAALLGQYAKPVSEAGFVGSYDSELLINYIDQANYNDTNASVGGLVISANNYLTVGSSTDQQSLTSEVRNIYITKTPLNSIGSEQSELKWITNLPSSGNVTTDTPQIVEFNPSLFLITWDQRSLQSPYNYESYYVFVNQDGNPVGNVTKIDADLSDCQPVVKNNTAYWYVSREGSSYDNTLTSITLYSLSDNGDFNKTTVFKPVPATDLTVSPETITIDLNSSEEHKIEAEVTPKNTTDKLTFTSDDPEIAEVTSDGLVEAKSAGSTTIQVQVGSIKKEVAVTVAIPATDITIKSEQNVTLNLGDSTKTSQIEASVQPENSTDSIKYESEDTGIARVNDNGLIEAVAPGSTQIKITAGNVTKTISVTVENPVSIYRLYNKTSGEHLYTSDENEYKTLPSYGWTQEGVGWNAPNEGTPVYRLYNPALADHLYTTDQNEVNVLTTQAGWQADNFGKPLFYSGGETPVYRLYNEGNYRHLLTKDNNEYNVLGGSGSWKQEGVGLKALN